MILTIFRKMTHLYLVGISSGKNPQRPLNEPEMPNIPIIAAMVEIMKYLLVLSVIETQTTNDKKLPKLKVQPTH